MMIYEIENLNSARKFLSSLNAQVTISNPAGSTRYYGMMAIDYMFQILQKEFPEKIDGFVVNAFDDYAAFVAAKKLGYKHIEYRG